MGCTDGRSNVKNPHKAIIAASDLQVESAEKFCGKSMNGFGHHQIFSGHPPHLLLDPACFACRLNCRAHLALADDL